VIRENGPKPQKSSEFDEGERPQLDLLRTNLDDAEDQLRRAQNRLDRAQRRVRNLEVAVQSWRVLVRQYEQALHPGRPRDDAEITL
jgi:predicted  nucleic acid-binding Zn-ribbon protein